MRFTYAICGVVVMLAFLLCAMPSSAEEGKTAAAPAPAQAQTPVQAPAPAVEKAEAVTPASNEISIYGEVKAVDAAVSTLNVQYYDYDTDEEKTAVIVVDQSTKLENAANISGIKQGDWADATYVVSDGRNVAKNIVVEKEEEAPAAPAAPAGTDTESDNSEE